MNQKQAIRRVPAGSKAGRRLVSGGILARVVPDFLRTAEKRERAEWNARVDAKRAARKANKGQ